MALTLLERAEAAGAFARLVVDDRTAVTATHGRLVAAAPAQLAGLIEIRGAGLQPRPFEARAVVRLIVDLVPPEEVARMPQEADLEARLAGIVLPRQPAPVGDIARAATLVAAALSRLSIPSPARAGEAGASARV